MGHPVESFVRERRENNNHAAVLVSTVSITHRSAMVDAVIRHVPRGGQMGAAAPPRKVSEGRRGSHRGNMDAGERYRMVDLLAKKCEPLPL